VIGYFPDFGLFRLATCTVAVTVVQWWVTFKEKRQKHANVESSIVFVSWNMHVCSLFLYTTGICVLGAVASIQRSFTAFLESNSGMNESDYALELFLFVTGFA
jgi:hypothetical protein